MPETVSVYTQLFCCVAYLAFAVTLPLRSTRAPLTIAMSAAAAATGIWAALAALAALGRVGAMAADFAMTVQTGAWLGVMLTVLFRRTQQQRVWLALALTAIALLYLQL